MRERDAGRLAALAGARVAGDADVIVGPDVVIDSRAATSGCLFVALPGEHHSLGSSLIWLPAARMAS